MTPAENIPFNPAEPTILYIDINSCFATIEQQANPDLRGRPTVVAAYTTPNGCILAASVEAKRLGVKTGMRVRDGQALCSDLAVVPSDPPKYRDVHLKLKTLLHRYTADVVPKSIDEFSVNLKGYPALKKGMREVSLEIKKRIKMEIGEWITVSIGIAPNSYLAKIAAGLHKPDGLAELTVRNYLEVYSRLALMELCGIKHRNAARLGSRGIYTVMDFYNASLATLKDAFASIVGYYWYMRLRGWEVDNIEFGRHSYGNSYALPRPLATTEELAPILYKLVEKTGCRLRNGGYKARGVHVSLVYRDGTSWHRGKLLDKLLFDSRDIYKEVYKILSKAPYCKPVAILAESCFGLVNSGICQLELFSDIHRKARLVKTLDKLTENWGEFTIIPARMVGTAQYVPDRIAFGSVTELSLFKDSRQQMTHNTHSQKGYTKSQRVFPN